MVSSRERQLVFASGLVVFGLVFLVFSRSLAWGFVGWDDVGFVVNNPNLGFSPEKIGWMFSRSFHGPYQPLAWLSLSLDHAWWGNDPFGYHLTANVLHALTAVLVFGWIKELSAYVDKNAGVGRQVLAGMVAALIFGLHPLRVETTSWISARRDLLMGFWVVASLWIYHRMAVRNLEGTVPWREMKMLFLCFLMACLGKASAVTLALVFCILDLSVYRRFSGCGGMVRLGTSFREKWGIWLISLIVGLVAVVSQKVSGEGMLPWSVYGLEERLAQSCLSLVIMLRQIFWPVNLSPLVELRIVPSFCHPVELTSLIFLLGFSGWVWMLRTKRPWLGAVWWTFIVTSLPTAGLFQAGLQLVADRYHYLPSLSWTVLMGTSVLALPRFSPGSKALPWLWSLIMTGILLVLTWGNWCQQGYWRNPETLWTRVIEIDGKNYYAQVALGRELMKKGQVTEASILFKSATQSRLDAPEAWLELGRIELSAGRYSNAVKAFHQVQRNWPQDAEALKGLEEAQQRLKRGAGSLR